MDLNNLLSDNQKKKPKNPVDLNSLLSSDRKTKEVKNVIVNVRTPVIIVPPVITRIVEERRPAQLAPPIPVPPKPQLIRNQAQRPTRAARKVVPQKVDPILLERVIVFSVLVKLYLGKDTIETVSSLLNRMATQKISTTTFNNAMTNICKKNSELDGIWFALNSRNSQLHSEIAQTMIRFFRLCCDTHQSHISIIASLSFFFNARRRKELTAESVSKLLSWTINRFTYEYSVYAIQILRSIPINDRENISLPRHRASESIPFDVLLKCRTRPRLWKVDPWEPPEQLTTMDEEEKIATAELPFQTQFGDKYSTSHFRYLTMLQGEEEDLFILNHLTRSSSSGTEGEPDQNRHEKPALYASRDYYKSMELVERSDQVLSSALSLQEENNEASKTIRDVGIYLFKDRWNGVREKLENECYRKEVLDCIQDVIPQLCYRYRELTIDLEDVFKSSQTQDYVNSVIDPVLEGLHYDYCLETPFRDFVEKLFIKNGALKQNAVTNFFNRVLPHFRGECVTAVATKDIISALHIYAEILSTINEILSTPDHLCGADIIILRTTDKILGKREADKYILNLARKVMVAKGISDELNHEIRRLVPQSLEAFGRLPLLDKCFGITAGNITTGASTLEVLKSAEIYCSVYTLEESPFNSVPDRSYVEEVRMATSEQMFTITRSPDSKGVMFKSIT